MAAIALLLAGCQTTEGEQALDWTNLDGDMPLGVIRGDLSRELYDETFAASQRLPRAASLGCGPFQVEIRANPDSIGTDNNISSVGRTGALYNGFFMLIRAPEGFSDRVRFRELFYPDFNARTYLKINGDWSDVTSPGYTSEPPATTDTFADLYLGFEPDRNPNAFFDNTYIAHVPWNEFVLRSIYREDYDNYPQGRYRISFTTPYELQWPNGSCQFRLPDLEFTYREG